MLQQRVNQVGEWTLLLLSSQRIDQDCLIALHKIACLMKIIRVLRMLCLYIQSLPDKLSLLLNYHLFKQERLKQ